MWGQLGQDRLGQIRALLRPQSHTDMGTFRGGQAEKDETISETGKFSSKDTQNRRADVGIWDMLGQMAGAWNRPEKMGTHTGQEGTRLGRDAKFRLAWLGVAYGGTGRDRCGVPGIAWGRHGMGLGIV